MIRLPRPPASDVRLAAGLGVAVAIESAIVVDASIGVVPAVAASLAIAAPLAWRRVLPATSATIIGFGALADMAFAEAELLAGTLVILVAVLSIFSLALHGRGRGLVVGAALCLVAYNGIGLLAPDASIDDVVFVDLILFAPAAVTGWLARRRRTTADRLEAVAAELERERGSHLATAAGAERTRLAGELHGTIAGGVAAMLREADAARALLDHDRSAAASRIAAVEEIGRDTLGQLRSALGVLRRDDDVLALAPQPTLARLDALATRAARDGVTVRVEIDGEPMPLSAGLDIAAYRLVEDALATLPGAAHAEVTVGWSPRRLDLDVAGDAPEADERGVAALRERVALFGGGLHVARRRGEGTRIHVDLPLEAVAA